MYKGYLEKLSAVDSIQLKEMFETLEKNPIYSEVIRNVKEQYFIKDRIHGISHNERVAMMSCYIAEKEDLSDDELRLVLGASLYHDIGRGYEGNHGRISAEIIEKNKEYIFPGLNDDEINVIKALCNCHSVDDSKYEEIAELYGVKDLTRFKKLLDVLKDADALDRVRLPKFGKLDEKYLRTDTAKEMVEIAEELYSEYTKIQRDEEIRIEEENKTKIQDDTEIIGERENNTRVQRDNEVKVRNGNEKSVQPEANDTLINRDPERTRKKPILFDGENYYLIRSLNKTDIQNLDNDNGILPKIDVQNDSDTYTTDDILSQVKMQHRKTSLISMSEDPNVVLTYDRTNLHRFVLVKIPKEQIEQTEVFFSAGDYLLDVMKDRVADVYQDSPEKVKQILDRVDQATTKQEVINIINGADKAVSTSLIESNQQYLTEEEQLAHSKIIAKCKVLYYYGLMRDVTSGNRINDFTSVMRLAYSSSEWLHYGKIENEEIISVPQILVEALSLLEQAKFQGKNVEEIRNIEQHILDLVKSGYELKENGELFEFSNGEDSVVALDSISKVLKDEYSSHSKMQADLTIDKAFEITNGGEISYRDTNMQIMAIRSLAEMTLKKRAIIELLGKTTSNQNLQELLENTYCINPDLTTRKNNRGNQISRNINLIITNYGYDLDNETAMSLIQSIDGLTTEQLMDINTNGVNSKILEDLVLKTREDSSRIESIKSKTPASRYIAEAIVEGYNWRKDGNSLTRKEKELLVNKILRGISSEDGLYKLYEAINKTKIGNDKFSPNEMFAIIINIAIDGRLGEITYKELLEKSRYDIQEILLENKESLQTTVLPISIDLIAGRGKKVEKLKNELIDLGVSKEVIETRDIGNVYVAKQIVDEYDFGREINQEEKSVIIELILSNSILNIQKYGRRSYLTSLIKNMEKIGLNQQEIYGMIINLGINGSAVQETGYNYTNMLQNIKNACQTISRYKNQIETEVTDGTILTAKSIVLAEREEQSLKEELINLGVSKEIVETTDIRNAYVAKQIVDTYDFGREISREESSSIIELMLNKSILKKGNSLYLTSLIKNMEKIGLNEQEIYGMIINLGVNEIAIQEIGYSYSIMIKNGNNACQTISKYKNQIQTEVTEGTILTARSIILAEREEQNLKEELINLGVSKEIVETTDIRNVYVAKQIVDTYNFGREVSQEERSAIIELILSNSILGKKSTRLLTGLIKNIEKIGLNQQEIYGMIINLGINGKVIQETGYAYKNMIENNNNVCQTISKYKEQIETEVTEGTILTAKSMTLDERKKRDLKEELINLGVSEKVIEEVDTRNVYVAKQIVDGYDFGREISQEERIAIIELILSNNQLKKKPALTVLIKNMEKIGLNQQETYGMVINLGINGSAVQEIGYEYTRMLSNAGNVCQTISRYKDQIQTKVTETTIKKAIKKEMPKAQKRTILVKKSRTLDEGKEQDLKEELINLGVSEKIIEEVDTRNIYVAKQIVDGYEFGREINLDERGAIIESILSHSTLKKGRQMVLLTSLIKNMEKIGLNEQEIYGMIINLGINGSVVQETGYDYSSMLLNVKNACQTISRYKDQIKTEVTEGTILTAKSKTIDGGKEQDLKEELINLGVSEKIIEEADTRNIYVAKQIVDGYEFGRKIDAGERSAIIELILSNSKLKRENQCI